MKIPSALKCIGLTALLAFSTVAVAFTPNVGPSVVFGPNPAQIAGATTPTNPETQLTEEQRAALDKNLAIFKNYPRMVIRLEGHASRLECKPELCLDLSAARIQLVYNYLVKNGLSPSRIWSLTAYGSNHTDPYRADGNFNQMGRVEIIFQLYRSGT